MLPPSAQSVIAATVRSRGALSCPISVVGTYTLYSWYQSINNSVHPSHCLHVPTVQKTHRFVQVLDSRSSAAFWRTLQACCAQHCSKRDHQCFRLLQSGPDHSSLFGAGAESEAGIKESPGDCRSCCGECSEEHQLPVGLCGPLLLLHHPAPQALLLGPQAGLLCGRYRHKCWGPSASLL